MDRLDNNINNYENLESFISPTNSIINSNSLKNFINTKKNFLLKKDDTNLNYKEEDKHFIDEKKPKIYSLKNYLFQNDNAFLLKGNNNYSKKIYQEKYINSKFISSNYFIILIQKLFRGFYYRKNIFPNKKINLENKTLMIFKKLYNEYLTENLLKQEENIGIHHNENSHKELYNI